VPAKLSTPALQIQLNATIRLKKKWQRTINRGSLLRILNEICLDPLVAEYIETLDLWNRQDQKDGHGQNLTREAIKLFPSTCAEIDS
jgi:hypothetical protein